MSLSFNQILQIFEDILIRRYNEILEYDTSEDKIDVKSFALFIFTCKKQYRMYAINHESQILEIWEFIRGNKHNFDTVMETMVELRLRIGDSYIFLKDQIKDSYGQFTSNGSIIDEETLERLPTMEKLKTFLDNNNWLVFFYLIQNINLKFTSPKK